MSQLSTGAPQNIPNGQVLSANCVKLLAPISGRDIMPAGENYMEQAKEFNGSGHVTADKTERPNHPIIFTERATRIIVCRDPTFSHDRQGEIGAITDKKWYRATEAGACDYVWGNTISNDMTRRSVSATTGPVAISKDDLLPVLKIDTHINSLLVPSSTTEDVLPSISTLHDTIP
ncbi:bifunctional 4-hydroxyphenylacetate degradation enzyme [Fusarium sp. NRRL 52700]|nr:bifunctional 4-hydroxyphenylacetate degradation enzyme [Fusarium sp. NRRL 52700]